MFSCEYCKLFKNSNIMEHLWWLLLDLFLACGSSRLEIFCKKVVLRNFAKFTGKHKKKRRWHIGFPVNFVKFIRTLFLTGYLQWLSLFIMSYPIIHSFSHILSRPLTGYLLFHFPVENIKWTFKIYTCLIYPLLQILLL